MAHVIVGVAPACHPMSKRSMRGRALLDIDGLYARRIG
jgi:hypothetical protein